jgi:putative hemolysin
VNHTAVTVLVICLLTGGVLFFSVSAAALRMFSRTRLLEAFRAADKQALADDLVKNAEKLILACSLYRLILNMCILLLLMAVFAEFRGGSVRVIDYVFALIIALSVFSIFSLAIPHAWAKYAGEKFLSLTYKPLLLLADAVWPVLYIWGLIDGLVRRLAGVVESTPEELHEEKQQDFLTGLEQRRAEGVVDEEEQQMIENVLELADTTAAEIMTPRTKIVAVEVSSDRRTVLDIITAAGHSRLPVYEDNIDNIVGLIYAKDLLSEIDRQPADFRLRDKLRKAYFVPETKPLRVLLHEFQEQKLHIAVLLDEYGGTAGIVTLEDILEELVGEITDEYEKSLPKSVSKLDKNTIEVDAATYIDDLNDQFELNLPEGQDYDTVGGFVFSHLGYIPKTAETFTYGSLRFTISSAEARRIKRIKIQVVSD